MAPAPTLPRWRWPRRLALGLGIAASLLVVAFFLLRAIPWRNRCHDPAPAPPPPGANAAVSTSQPLATAAAAEVLRAGGTAVDAAIAAALMLGVAEPANSGLGGGGFALVHDAATRRDLTIDFRERAPLALDVTALAAAIHADANALRDGPLAVAVPSAWNGLLELHRRFGSLPLRQLAQPAIRAAREGVVVGRDYASACWVRLGALRADPDARKTFLTSSGLCPLAGWTLHQPALAATLEALTDDAHPATWDALVGHKTVAFLAARGSTITDVDLAAARPVEEPVVEGRFHGRRIVSIGPPSAGGTLVIALLQSYEQMRLQQPAAHRLRLWIDAARLAFFDRATLFGDPERVDVPVVHLLSAAYADAQARRVPALGRVELPDAATATEGIHTTHISVVDARGNAVALTQTINTPFGAALVVPGTGVLLNDEMDDFYVDTPNAWHLPGSARNAPLPGARPLSSISPTFVFDDAERLTMVLGAPGGGGIPAAVAQVIRAVVEDGLDGEAAVRAPRVHHTWQPDVLQVEPDFDRTALPPDVATRVQRAWLPIGRVQMVIRDAHGWRGVSDCRDDGASWAAVLGAIAP